MRGLSQQLAVSLRLYFRNRMAMLYGYLFPTVFLIAFWVLYRYERVPLVRHMGELLTVTILGGACFGLATTLVSERERGVWRRFKLVPIPTGTLVVSTVVARYVLLVTAGLLQLVLALLAGMPWPAHPFDLWVAFTCASFAFLGLGLVIAMLADNVPAVQALGQSIFLPMLIIGGVAVPLTALPDWAQRISAFFPGRYAVEAIQAAVNGGGTRASGFNLIALIVIGTAACLAGGRMFRWDAQQRFRTSRGKGWLALALASWIGVGLYAEYRGYIRTLPPAVQTATGAPASSSGAGPAVPTPVPGTTTPMAPAGTPATSAASAGVETPRPSALTPAVAAAPQAADAASTPPASPAPASTPPPAPGPAATAPPAASDGWQAVTMTRIDEEIIFTRLPPDGGVVTPIAAADQELDPATLEELEALRVALLDWAPGRLPEPVQRVRNLLFVASVIDVFQMPTESAVPLIIFDRIQQDIPAEDLPKILFWIAVHPDEGSDSAVDQMQPLGIANGPGDMQEVRGRAAVYAVKLLGRITGKRPGR